MIHYLLASWLALSGIRLPEKYQKWLDEEVVYIISGQERSAFKALATDSERDGFIERFWKIRDTDSSTEDNEFKKHHYARILYANEHFHDGIPGWKSDRGRIWILHGPPDSRHYAYGAGSLAVEIENPTEVLTGEAGGDRRRPYRLTLSLPEAEAWIYYHIDGAASVSGYFEVIFSRTDPVRIWELSQNLRSVGGSVVSARAQRVQRDLAIMTFLRSYFFGGPYRIVYAGEYRLQDMDDFFQSIFHPQRMPSIHVMDFNAALRDLERSSGEVLMDRLAVTRRLRERVQSRVFFEDLPMDVRVGTLQSASGGTLVPVCLGLAARDAHRHLLEGDDMLDVLLELVGEGGEVKASLADSLQLGAGGNKETQGERYLYQTRLAARPGTYKLSVYATLRKHQASAYREFEIRLPDYGSGDLLMSDLLLFERVVPKKEFANRQAAAPGLPTFLGGSRPIYLKDYVLIPSGDSRFRRAQKLTAFFEVYNPGLQGPEQTPHIEVLCRLKAGDGSELELPQRALGYLTDSGARRTTYGVSIPLLGFPRGDYSVTFEVRDVLQAKAISKSTTFSIY
jgi:GWxTD domain-containing protein